MARVPETKTVYQAEAKCLDVNARTAQDTPRVELRLFIGGDMVRKSKGTEGKTGDRVLDLRSTGVTRLNVSPAGLTGTVVAWRKMKAPAPFLLQVEENI